MPELEEMVKESMSTGPEASLKYLLLGKKMVMNSDQYNANRRLYQWNKIRYHASNKYIVVLINVSEEQGTVSFHSPFPTKWLLTSKE